MRFSGKYTKTRTLTYNERKGIIDVLNGYDVLNTGKYYNVNSSEAINF